MGRVVGQHVFDEAVGILPRGRFPAGRLFPEWSSRSSYSGTTVRHRFYKAVRDSGFAQRARRHICLKPETFWPPDSGNSQDCGHGSADAGSIDDP